MSLELYGLLYRVRTLRVRYSTLDGVPYATAYMALKYRTGTPVTAVAYFYYHISYPTYFSLYFSGNLLTVAGAACCLQHPAAPRA